MQRRWLSLGIAAIVVAGAVLGLALLPGMVVGLVIGGLTVVAVLYDSATMSRARPGGVVVGEIDQDFGSTTQKLPELELSDRT